MNLAFATEELRACCESQVEGERALGVEVARQLRERLASLREVESVLELPTGSPREVIYGAGQCYEVFLPDRLRLVLRPNHKKLPLLAGADRVDWSRVSRVLICCIEKVEVDRG